MCWLMGGPSLAWLRTLFVRRSWKTEALHQHLFPMDVRQLNKIFGYNIMREAECFTVRSASAYDCRNKAAMRELVGGSGWCFKCSWNAGSVEEVVEKKSSLSVVDICVTLISPKWTGTCASSYGNFSHTPNIQCSGWWLASFFAQPLRGPGSLGTLRWRSGSTAVS
jgi:hypothetical protein